MNVILLERDEVTVENRAIVTGVRARHMRQVLGVAPGSSVRIGLVNGPHGTGTVVAIDEDCIGVACTWDDEPPRRPAVDLLLALPRPKVLKRLFAQIAALGVGRLLLTNAARVERHYFDTHVLDERTYRPLLVEGLQQARDTRLPEVSIHRQFRVLVEDDLPALCPGTHKVVTHPGEARSLHAVIREARTQRQLIAIGPEGGWNAFELSLLEGAGFHRADAGPRPLRSDTACIALLALAHDALREKRGD